MVWPHAYLGKSADWVLKSLSGRSFCFAKPVSMLEMKSYWHLSSLSDLLYFVFSHTLLTAVQNAMYKLHHRKEALLALVDGSLLHTGLHLHET